MKKIFTVLSLLVISGFMNAQTFNWEWQNPKPHGNDVNDIKYFGSNTVIAVGNAGTLQRSTDGGSKWSIIKADTSYRDINSVYFLDNNKGFLCGTAGLLMKTTDAGLTWKYLNSGTTEDLYDVKFFNADTGYAFGGKGTILKTKNSGDTWAYTSFGTGTIYKGYILNASTIFIGCSTKDFKLSKSTDFGQTWTAAVPTTMTSSIYSITFIDSVTGFYGAGDDNIYKTTDGGATWTNKTSITGASINVTDIEFVSKTEGYAVDAKGNVYKTTNAGDSWTITKIPFQKFSALSSNSGSTFISGLAGTVLKSDDAGANWTPKYTSTTQQPIRQVTFVDANTGYASGGSTTGADSLGFILKTTNGGTNWEVMSNTFKAQVYGFAITSPSNWCAVGSGNSIFRSTDAGANWTKIASPVTGVTNMVFYSVAFGGKDTGYAAGNSGKMIKTTDGGATWTNVTSNMGTNTIFDLVVFDSKTVIICGLAGKVSKTTDGGTTWTALAPNVAGGLFVLKFKDSKTGYVGGGSKALSKTTDGGATWTPVTLPSSLAATTSIWGVGFGKNTEWISTGNGEICFSADGGKTWALSNTLTTTSLFDITTAGDNVWIAGNNGIILKGKSDPYTSVKQEKTTAVKGFELAQNYPNPFNPSTTIRYTVASEGMVSLKIYNLLGKEVANLINQHQSAGSYSVEFNASNLSSGIYFYELRNGSNVMSKKMILMK